VLRGLSALAVAVYHLLMWQDIAALNTFGRYGVYLFFVLSGASLAYTYAGRFEQGRFSMAQFLWVRYFRLAPLYITLMLVVLPWKLLKEGMTGALLTKVGLNAFFLFGFFNPSINASLVGGWSLGIEAIFYLLFPLVLATASSRAKTGIAAFVMVVLVQVVWISWVFDLPGGYAANEVVYHQVPAFAAYFMGGCLLGLARRAHPVSRAHAALAWVGTVGGFAAMLLLNTPHQGDELVGWRGATLFMLCFVMAWLAGHLDLRGRNAQRLAAHLGDSTYGVYLIHPVVFFGLSFVLFPRTGLAPPQQWALGGQLALAIAVMLASFALAIVSERHFERPLRDWSKSRIGLYRNEASASSQS
jgi:peptidoglycan/LPS O-acetylase OafA/YrhL